MDNKKQAKSRSSVFVVKDKDFNPTPVLTENMLKQCYKVHKALRKKEETKSKENKLTKQLSESKGEVYEKSFKN